MQDHSGPCRTPCRYTYRFAAPTQLFRSFEAAQFEEERFRPLPGRSRVPLKVADFEGGSGHYCLGYRDPCGGDLEILVFRFCFYVFY